MCRIKNRSKLHVEAIEAKLVPSALAPVAGMQAAGEAAHIERAVSHAIVGINEIRIRNATDKTIHVWAHLPAKSGYAAERIDWIIAPNKTQEFRFKPPVPGFIHARIASTSGAPPEFSTMLNATGPNGGYDNKLFTFSTFGGRFSVSL